MSKRYECPYCHRSLMGPEETCGGSLTEHRHPPAAKAVENQSDVHKRCNVEEERRDQGGESRG